MKTTTENSQPEILERLRMHEPMDRRAEEQAVREHTIATLRLLWEKRRFLVRATIFAFILSTVAAFLIPARYESTARLMPPDSSSGSNLAMLAAASGRAGAGGLGSLAGDVLGLKSTSALFVGILQSRTVEDRLIEKFDLKKVYWWVWRIEDARAKLESRTRVAEDRKSGIVTISVSDNDPQRARDMAQAYVEELNRLVAEVSTSAARRERTFIEERLKVVKQELNQASVEFSQFASKNTAIDIKEQGRTMVEAAATVQGQLIAAQSEFEGLKQMYTESNVRVRAVRARIAELQLQLEKLGRGDMAVNVDGGGAPSLYPSIRKLPLLGVQYADLYRRTRIQETVYELLTQQYELAKVQEAKEIPTVKVLDEPVVPEKKSFPPRIILILLGTMFATSFSVVWLFGMSWWAEREPKDPAKVLVQDVYATLKAQLDLLSQNGSGAGRLLALWNRLRRQRDSAGAGPASRQ